MRLDKPLAWLVALAEAPRKTGTSGRVSNWEAALERLEELLEPAGREARRRAADPIKCGVVEGSQEPT